MACMLRGLWIFHAESDVRLLMSRKFPTVEKKMQRLLGDDYVALPSDEDINMMFITEILHEEEDHFIPEGIPEPFHEDFRQGSFSWNAEQEAYAEKLWPMGPVCSINNGKIWPVLFLFKKGFYLVTVVALEKKYRLEQVRALELPQITAAFAVLEDICDFIPATLTIADVAGISELQYYIRSAVPFGSPVNTNSQLLRKVKLGFPSKEEEATQRSPAWKPYLYKGKSKLTLSIVETVNCTLYGKAEYKDECFIAGTVYCCADISGIPEICVPISYHNEQGLPPEITVHNCAHVVGGIKSVKEDSFKISCTPPTGPFVICRYRYANSPIVPIRGFYQIKEMSPVEFRLLLQIQFHPIIGGLFWNCQVRLPFQHRGTIKAHDLKCSGGSFTVVDQGQSILWNLNVRRPRGNLETNLLGELIFESPQAPDTQERQDAVAPARASPTPGGSLAGGGGSAGGAGAGGTVAGGAGSGASGVAQGATATGEASGSTSAAPRVGSGSSAAGAERRPSTGEGGTEGGEPAPAASGGAGSGDGSGAGNASGGGSTPSAPGAAGSGSGSIPSGTAGEPAVAGSRPFQTRGTGMGEERTASTKDSMGLPEDRTSGKAGAGTTPQQPSTGGYVQDPFLHGVNCCAEVFLEVPDTTLSGIMIDPKAVTVYPTTRVYGGVSVQKEVLTGKYVIWNMAGEVRGSHSELEFDEQPRPTTPPGSEQGEAVMPTTPPPSPVARGDAAGITLMRPPS